jgi:hypothetical protein
MAAGQDCSWRRKNLAQASALIERKRRRRITLMCLFACAVAERAAFEAVFDTQ